MRKGYLLILIAIFTVFTVQSCSVTLDDIVEKHIKARGGAEKLESIQSIKTTGKYYMQGTDYPFTTYQKRPHSIRIETIFQDMTIIQAYDGKTAWAIMPYAGSTEPQKLPAEQTKGIKYQADYDGFLVGYQDKGYTIQLLGKEDMEGTDVYHLELDTHEDIIVHLYLDASNFLELKMSMNDDLRGEEVRIDTYKRDYREIDGVMIPHSIESLVEGKVLSRTTIEKIELNANIDDAFFAMPEKEEKKEDLEEE